MLPRRVSVSTVVDLIIIGLIAASLAVLVPETIRNLRLAGAADALDGGMAAALVAAVGLYITAHVLRAVRLYLIVGVGTIRFTAILGYHSVISLGTLASPLKLGEVARALDLYRLLANDLRGVFAVWADRLLDVVFVVLALLALIVAGQRQTAVVVILVAGLAFLILSAMALVLLPAALKSLARALLASNSTRSMLLLRACTGARGLLASFPRFDRSTIALLAALTVVIWTLELTVITLVLSVLAEPRAGLLAGAADIFVSVLFVPVSSAAPHVALYRLVTVMSLAPLIAVFAFRYLQTRRARARSLALVTHYRGTSALAVATPLLRGRVR